MPHAGDRTTDSESKAGAPNPLIITISGQSCFSLPLGTPLVERQTSPIRGKAEPRLLLDFPQSVADHCRNESRNIGLSVAQDTPALGVTEYGGGLWSVRPWSTLESCITLPRHLPANA